MDLNRFKSDPTREEDGVWVEVGDGARLRIARIGSKKYHSEFTRRSKPYKRQIRSETLPDSVADKILAETLASAVLLDWDGLTLGGKALKYSRDKAVELLMDPAMKDFRALVVELATDAEQYRADELEADAKN